MPLIVFSYLQTVSLNENQFNQLRNALPELLAKHFQCSDWKEPLISTDVDVCFQSVEWPSVQNTDIIVAPCVNQFDEIQANLDERREAFTQDLLARNILPKGLTVGVWTLLGPASWGVVRT